MMRFEDLNSFLPCRSKQFELLGVYLDEYPSPVLPSMFVFGLPATGKSSVIRFLIPHLKHKYVNVNCIECYTPRLLYESILEQLDPTFENKCDNPSKFVDLLQDVVKEHYGDNHSIYIHFEKSERLRDIHPLILPMFLKLRELSELNIGVILESNIVWEKFRSGTGFREPIVIGFPEYNKDELLKILSLDAPDGITQATYENFINLLLDVFHMVCRNLSELRYLAHVNLNKYLEPIAKGEATEDDTVKLWKNVEPHLKKAMHQVFLREVSGDQWMKIEQLTAEACTTPAMNTRSTVEIPVYTKYLLIAAYLASYNPAKLDKRFFMKNAGKTSKRSLNATKKKEERTSCHLLGPKYFPLDRMMAIFYSIIDEKIIPTANTFSQISSLVSLGLLSQATAIDQFDNQKYKCLVTLEQIKSVAKSVGFEIMRYLYDFI